MRGLGVYGTTGSGGTLYSPEEVVGRASRYITDNHSADSFALRGAHTPGRKRAEVEAVNAYQESLQRAYTDWADDLAQDVAAAEDEDNRDEIVAAALLALLLLLRKLGRDTLPDAVALGLDGTSAPATVWAKLTAAIEANDKALADSLIPALRLKLDELLNDPDVIAAIQFGGDAGAAAVSGGLLKFVGRVGMAAGAYWALFSGATGEAAKEQKARVYWERDPQAVHCPSCLAYGDREYESWDALLAETGGVWPANGTDCQTQCRCTLQVVV